MIGPLTEGQRRNVAVVNSLHRLQQAVTKVRVWTFSTFMRPSLEAARLINSLFFSSALHNNTSPSPVSSLLISFPGHCRAGLMSSSSCRGPLLFFGGENL